MTRRLLISLAWVMAVAVSLLAPVGIAEWAGSDDPWPFAVLGVFAPVLYPLSIMIADWWDWVRSG